MTIFCLSVLEGSFRCYKSHQTGQVMETSSAELLIAGVHRDDELGNSGGSRKVLREGRERTVFNERKQRKSTLVLYL